MRAWGSSPVVPDLLDHGAHGGLVAHVGLDGHRPAGRGRD
jgi:hypothetical protein